jgi:copper(I)-binding protein
MKRALVLAAALLLAAFSAFSAAHAENMNPPDVKAGDLVVSNIWARASATPTGAIYFTVADRGPAADALIGISTDLAAQSMLHQSILEDGVSKMRMVKIIDIPAHGSVSLQPGGYHVMLMGLKSPLKAGTRIDATLTFARAGSVIIHVPVRGLGEGAPDIGNMPGMGGGK